MKSASHAYSRWQKLSPHVEHWWHDSEVVRVFPDGNAVDTFHNRLTHNQLGRKRLHNTLFPTSLHEAGIKKAITNNERDFEVIGNFEIIRF